ncbi:SDR family oxidoreductase [Bifidobacterium cuniculi]|uniref:SDR family oxidoreductase n=1 Tax=Bifidobacterium cuniculi TaxID=1688 RepID=UPI001EF9FC85|nr:SDR family oxidoreductase [Bifidobacterium cuniculi]
MDYTIIRPGWFTDGSVVTRSPLNKHQGVDMDMEFHFERQDGKWVIVRQVASMY